MCGGILSQGGTDTSVSIPQLSIIIIIIIIIHYNTRAHEERYTQRAIHAKVKNKKMTITITLTDHAPAAPTMVPSMSSSIFKAVHTAFVRGDGAFWCFYCAR